MKWQSGTKGTFCCLNVSLAVMGGGLRHEGEVKSGGVSDCKRRRIRGVFLLTGFERRQASRSMGWKSVEDNHGRRDRRLTQDQVNFQV